MPTSEAEREALLARLFGAEAVPSPLSTELLRTRDVARAFQVSERTIAEWARRGRIPSVRTPGGHRLYPAERIREILRDSENAAERGPRRAGGAGKRGCSGVVKTEPRAAPELAPPPPARRATWGLVAAAAG